MTKKLSTECPGPARTSVYSVQNLAKDVVGKIIIAWPKDGAGRVYASVSIPQAQCWLNGYADGYGYDKCSAAIANALLNGHITAEPPTFSGCGDGPMERWFERVLNLKLERLL